MASDSNHLKDALDASSATNRNLFLFFLFFQVALLVLIGSTTDLMLFLPNSTIQLPLLGVSIPVKAFYIFAPLLNFAIHFNILFNFEKHLHKLQAWRAGKKHTTKQQEDLHPYLFNYYEKDSSGSWLLSTLMWVLYFLLPLCIALVFLIRFSDYHQIYISSWHFFIIILTFILNCRFWIKVIRNIDKPIPFSKVIQASHNGNFLTLIEKFELFTIYIFNYHKKSIVSFFSFALIMSICVWQYSRLTIVVTSVMAPPQDAYVTIFNNEISDWFFPRLTLEGENLVKKDLSNELKAAIWLNPNNEKIDLTSNTKGYNLKARNFRYANLTKAKLWKANLFDSDLQRAIFMETDLSNANLSATKLQNTFFYRAILNKANFENAKLESANLDEAQMRGATFHDAKFIKTSLFGVEAQAADFTKSTHAGSDFEQAALQLTLFKDLTFLADKNADTDSIKFVGADLTGAIFSKSPNSGKLNGNFSCAKLCGTSLPLEQLEEESKQTIHKSNCYDRPNTQTQIEHFFHLLKSKPDLLSATERIKQDEKLNPNNCL